MNALIKAATVIDSKSPHNGNVVDIRIKDGIITEIASTLTPSKNEKTITFDDLKVSSGWFDTSVSIGEPGYEERETIKNGLKVAALSGFTGIAVNPNTNPIIDTSADVAFMMHKSAGNATELFPIGALSRNSESVDLAELYDMQQSGAVAFGDYQKPVSNPNLLKIALQYTQGFDGLVLSFPQENDIAGKGQVNEGVMSTRIGLKGKPAIAESLQVARDLHILEYTGGKLHIPTISTKASVHLIADAKAKGLDVTSSAAIHNLFFTDDVLEDFNTNYKVTPPLRNQDDVEALIQGIKTGVIDFVTSDHNPLDVERKHVEFDNATYGTISQEATFGALLTLVSEKKAVKLLTQGRARFTNKEQSIVEGANANLTLFSIKGSYTFSESDIKSKSKNAAFLGAKLKGKVYGIVNNNQIILND
ncbi:dihydroorotase [Dokdonia sinensis]|uniref:Dihydroorotase n=1 Tax=Dokdonia sinensis TaxID=2479847 RepID=A0A3M0G4Q4_9FLAO|nr:dihydroorotase [Dokdonia sinensis]RMB59548.1 dihydroorotase [Dokdonia sinensis]